MIHCDITKKPACCLIFKKNASGIRDYSDSDCERVEFIKCMRSAGMPVERLSKYISLCLQGEDTAEERRNMLIQQRKELIEKRDAIQTTIDRLDYKIDIYYKILKEKENALHAKKINFSNEIYFLRKYYNIQ